MEINWVNKRKSGFGYREFKDVGIFLIPKEKAVRFAFRNKCERRITNEDYVQVGYTEEKIYFKKSNEYSGTKLTTISNGKSKYTRVKDKELFYMLQENVGERELFYERESKLYYIYVKESEE